MKIRLIFTLTIFSMVVACNQTQSSSPGQWSETELTEWFNDSEWKQEWEIQPDESVNPLEFAIQYHKNPKRWDKAFLFLKEQDLASLEPGRYELEGTDLFVNVDTYSTKNEKDALFEAHQKYADIQYMVSGEEKIGVLPLEETTVTTPYDDKNNIVFLTSEEENYRLATPDHFFVFFPDDAHQPCVKTSENTEVRKVVVKVRID